MGAAGSRRGRDDELRAIPAADTSISSDIPMQQYNESAFRAKVEAALARVKTIIDVTRQPQLPSEVQHQYEDKYILAEYLTKLGIASLKSILDDLGVSEKDVDRMRDWAKSRAVTLRFKAEESCKFLRKVSREVESDTAHVSTGILGKYKSFSVTKVTDYYWQFDVSYELFAFCGTDVDRKVSILRRTGTLELKTSSDSSPRPQNLVRPHIDCQLTWLFQRIDSLYRANFTITRTAATCRTPRRNPEIDAAFAFFAQYYSWAGRVGRYLSDELFPVNVNNALDLSALNDDSIFNPIFPVFEKSKKAVVEASSPRSGTSTHRSGKSSSSSSSSKHGKEKKESSKKKDRKDKKEKKGELSPREWKKALVITKGSDVVPTNLVDAFIEELKRSVQAKFKEIDTVFQSDTKFITAAEGRLVILLRLSQRIAQAFADGIDYIEDMLRKQLISAIGKEVTAVDFQNYMRFHQRKLYRPEYQPKPFAYAVRRGLNSPEGLVQIEAVMEGGGINDPIFTLVSHSRARRPMTFPLTAASEVSFKGDRYVHGWLNQQFAGDSGLSLLLTARARAFSSFILVVGRIAGPTQFEAKAALLIQNKDELAIPLMLETIPAPKEFKKAVESMSPEQQRFAKAFRAMQLESTLFGLLVIQIRPQMERLLNLPLDSLSKEIELTQELLDLFIQYQIPPDQLSFDGLDSASKKDRIQRVRQCAAKMRAMINRTKKEELGEALEEAVFRAAEEDRLSDASSGASSQSDIDYEEDDDGDYGGYHEEEKEVDYEGGSMKKMTLSLDDMVQSNIAPREMSAKRMIAPPAPRGKGAPSPKPATSAATGKKMDMEVANKRVAAPLQQQAKPPEPKAAVAKPKEVKAADAKPKEPEPPKPDPSKTEKTGQKEPERLGEGLKPTSGEEADDEEAPVVDYTKLPTELEAKFDALDDDGTLRPTIINIGETWTKRAQPALLGQPVTSTLAKEEQEKERNKAFDLLDAITKSGELPVEDAALHVLVAATHCFDKTLINTIIQGNVNPIEKVERSSLIVATSVFAADARQLIVPDQHDRVALYSPKLLPAIEAPVTEEAKGAGEGEPAKIGDVKDRSAERLSAAL